MVVDITHVFISVNKTKDLFNKLKIQTDPIRIQRRGVLTS